MYTEHAVLYSRLVDVGTTLLTLIKLSSHTSVTCSEQNSLFLDTERGSGAGCKLGCQLKLQAWPLVRVISKISSGTQSALSSNVSHGRHGNTHGTDREPHRTAGNEHCPEC